MTTLQVEEPVTKWFCETCMETTPHTHYRHPTLKRRTYKCVKCGEEYTRNYESSGWSSRKRSRKYYYQMECTHCGHVWRTMRLKQPKKCPQCQSKHIKILTLTKGWK